MIGSMLRGWTAVLAAYFPAVVAALGIAFSAVGANAKEIHWKEEVRLTTGEVIVIERGESLRSVYDGGPLRPSWLFDEAWLSAKLPGIREVRWKGSVSPLVLNVNAKGEWYLLGIVVAYRGRQEYNLPDGKSYVAFKLDSGEWKRILFAEFPIEFQPNLLADTHTLFIERNKSSNSLVNLKLKEEIDSAPMLPRKYKRVDRSLGE